MLVTVGIDEEMGKSNDIRVAVIDDLTFDPDVDASDIRVEEDRDVVLTGSVPSYSEHVQVAAVAARVVGVRFVRNYLQVALPLGNHRGARRLLVSYVFAASLRCQASNGAGVT